MKIVTVIGARPQFIKAAALSRCIRNKFSDQIREEIIHTGQHFDHNMSGIFFEELGIPVPKVDLNPGGHERLQTGSMVTGIASFLEKEKPDKVLVYGDTDSTMAGALAASRCRIPLVHIESGLRAYNEKLPEEINRVVADNLSEFLFAPTEMAVENLKKEGIVTGKGNYKVFNSGDIMVDAWKFFKDKALQNTKILSDLELENKEFSLVTIHRNTNTDDPEILRNILEGLLKSSQENNLLMVWPVHPRTKLAMEHPLVRNVADKLKSQARVKLISGVGYLEMLALEANSSLILTDSGGVQKEAFFFRKPCVVLRNETEWIELEKCGAAIIAGNDPEKIAGSFNMAYNKRGSMNFPDFYGSGESASYICKTLLKE